MYAGFCARGLLVRVTERFVWRGCDGPDIADTALHRVRWTTRMKWVFPRDFEGKSASVWRRRLRVSRTPKQPPRVVSMRSGVAECVSCTLGYDGAVC